MQMERGFGATSLVWGSFKQAGHVLHLVKVVPFNLLISVPALSSFAICSDEMWHDEMFQQSPMFLQRSSPPPRSTEQLRERSCVALVTPNYLPIAELFGVYPLRKPCVKYNFFFFFVMISMKNLALRWVYLSVLVTNTLFCCQLEV